MLFAEKLAALAELRYSKFFNEVEHAEAYRSIRQSWLHHPVAVGHPNSNLVADFSAERLQLI
jgi:hypothetical protein